MITSGKHLEEYQLLIEKLVKQGNTRNSIATILKKQEFQSLVNRDLITAMMVYALAAATAGDSGDLKASTYSTQIFARARIVADILGQSVPERLDHLLSEIDESYKFGLN
ncbi:MAG: hypothetical protein HXX08_07285 [Chloroflexi bacterium]|uniref:Uncharacterized protein n=1 Tax=Candidatus Chlorohelix allophototropha TaxID=3003348 RepID=A0A8T7M2X1_9CHLR|nr:hypothetical protein [Chloroflexota bacterium]WJW67535.1 hypothetical protein OZ401_000802 [Chloroflexota bacterium L227-S17]